MIRIPDLIRYLSCLACLAVLSSFAPAESPKPDFDGYSLKAPTFGSARDVELLAGLLTDDDPLVREEAARDLGETHNAAAEAPLTQALADATPAVRAAAVRAMVELKGVAATETVGQALKGASPVVILAALEQAERIKAKALSEPVSARLADDRAVVRARTIETMTKLGLGIKPEVLDTLIQAGTTMGRVAPDPWQNLTGDDLRVRLRALENAAVTEKVSREVLERAAQPSEPEAIRAAAVAAIGKHTGAVPAWAEKSKSALIRRGACRGWTLAGKGDKAVAFLDDASPLVRLAAIEAAEQFKPTSRVDRLATLMIDAPDDGTHIAARSALLAIANDTVAAAAAKHLKGQWDRLKTQQPEEPEEDKPTAKPEPKLLATVQKPDPLRTERNIRSCCEILGAMKSKAGLETMLAMTPQFDINSKILGSLADAMGLIGDPRSREPLSAAMTIVRQRVRAYLTSMVSMRPSPPFSEAVAGQIAQALIRLEADSSYDAILRTVRTKVQMVRPGQTAAYVAQMAPAMTAPAARKSLEAFLLDVLDDSNYGLAAQYYAAMSVGRMKLASAEVPLRTLLTEERPCRTVMRAAAWAIEAITGSSATVGDPVVRQGDWIIRTVRH